MTWPGGIDVELLANDLSFHEQFHDVAAFRTALSRLMAMRHAARRFEREVALPPVAAARQPNAGYAHATGGRASFR